MYEVDGEAHKLYTQNLSLFAKLFLDTKSVFYDTTTFLYYLIVAHDPNTPTTDWECAVFGDEYEKGLRVMCPTLKDYLVTRRAEQGNTRTPRLAMLD